MEIEAKEVKSIEDGKHSGVIKSVDYRLTPYEYVDFFIEIKDEKFTGVELKVGYPARISTQTALGQLLIRFGIKIEPKIKYDPAKLLVGKECIFQTITETVKDKGEFSRVIAESVKPKI